MVNKHNERGVALRLAVGSGVLSGDPVLIGTIPWVASTDYSATDGKASLDREGVFNLSVKGADDSGNLAVAVGDPIYMVTGDTPVLSKKRSGVYFGVALDVVTSGSTTTIRVLIGSPLPASASKGPFVSAEQTGTGSAQSIAHGLGVVPRAVIATPTDTSPSTAGVFIVTEGTHTTTNVVITVTTSKKYKVVAWI